MGQEDVAQVWDTEMGCGNVTWGCEGDGTRMRHGDETWGWNTGIGHRNGTRGRSTGAREATSPAVPATQRATVVRHTSALKSYPVTLRSASEMTTFLFIVQNHFTIV